MKTIRKVFLASMLFLGAQVTFGMGPQRISPDESILQKLKEFHDATWSSGNPKPKMKNFQKQRRRFVAKMDSFGLDRYFSFKTDEDVDALAQAVQQGGGMKVEWFYYDQEEDECTISIQQYKPNVVVISDDKDDDE